MALEGKTVTVNSHQGGHIPASSKHQLSNQQNSNFVFKLTSTHLNHDDRIEV